MAHPGPSRRAQEASAINRRSGLVAPEQHPAATEAVVVRADERTWSTWPEEQVEQRGGVWWKTLISAGTTPSRALSLGVARVPPAGALRPHRHAQPEVYLVLEGAGELTLGGAVRRVAPGDAVFIPGGAVHGIACAGSEELRFAYAFPADSTTEVEYDFGPAEAARRP